ncbi:hypothetical protein P280DRAFT_302431 [Massarina eburnea CBS 473.64]|uniref:Uncharacterized protein n=1 Tax=Massarina eburnea CBS 473.64 TaxID=1395130 RepID=A0A6A6S1U9_9PLEO|nr:hypothetical protein P280DRAFT_302431 [Massarina eburnea CBS 473.64]
MNVIPYDLKYLQANDEVLLLLEYIFTVLIAALKIGTRRCGEVRRNARCFHRSLPRSHTTVSSKVQDKCTIGSCMQLVFVRMMFCVLSVGRRFYPCTIWTGQTRLQILETLLRHYISPWADKCICRCRKVLVRLVIPSKCLSVSGFTCNHCD